MNFSSSSWTCSSREGGEVDFIIINVMEQKFVVTEVEDPREDEEERSGGSSSRP